MARQVQRTVILPAGQMADVERMAASHADYIDAASFYKWSLVIGAHILDQTLLDIKPGILGERWSKQLAPGMVEFLLKTKVGRRAIKVEATEKSETE